MDDLEMEMMESSPENQQPADPAPEEAAPADTAEDAGSEETPVTDPENPEEETGSEDGSEGTGSGEETGAEDQTGESETENPAESDEMADLTGEAADQTDDTVSGNDVITISGNAVIFPEDFDLSQLSSNESSTGDLTAVADMLETQNNNITAGFACVSFLLGLLAGAIIVSGFRLRRV